MATQKKKPQSKPLSRKAVKSIREQKTLMGKIGALAGAKAKGFKEHLEESVKGGATTKTGIALNLLGAHGAKNLFETFYGKNKSGGDGDIDEVSEKIENTATKQARMLQSIRDVVKSHTARLKAIEGTVGLILEDMADIKALLMPKTLIAKGRKGTAAEGQTQTAYFNPLAPSGNQMGQIRDGKLTPLKVGKNFEQSAIMKASYQSATLALKIAKKDQERTELRKKNQWKDPKELSRRGDPIAVLRQEMNDNFRKVFEMLEDLKKGVEESANKGDGILDTIADLAIARSLLRRGGGRGRGARGRGRTGAPGKAGKPVSPKAMERYQRRFGKAAAEKRFGKPKKAGGGIGVGALVGGGLAYAAVDSMRDKDLVSQDPEELKKQAAEAKASGDAEKLKQLDKQVKAQKKDVKIQAAATGAAVGGAVAGQAVANRVWKLFVNYVKKHGSKKLVAFAGKRLASVAAVAAVPGIGWFISLGMAAWMAWDLYQLWKQFSALSEAEKDTYTDEVMKAEELKDKPGAKIAGATITVGKAPDYAMARELAASDIRTGPSTRGGRRGKGGATPTAAVATGAAAAGAGAASMKGGGGQFGGSGASGSWSAPAEKKPTGEIRAAAPEPKIGSSQMKQVLLAEMDKQGITGKHRAALLAQVHHETGGFRSMTENLNYSAKRLRQVFPNRYKTDEEAAADAGQPQKIAMRVYGNRKDLGNETAEDGWKYRGRGFIQLTGKYNYKKFGDIVGADLVGNPDLAANPQSAAALAVQYYKKVVMDRGVNPDETKLITKLVNGGQHGIAERTANYSAYLKDTGSMQAGGGSGGSPAMVASTGGSAAGSGASSVSPAKTVPAGAVEGESRQMQAANRSGQAAPVVINAPTTNTTQVASTGPKPTGKKASAVSQDDSLIRMSGRDAQHPVLA